MISLQELIRHIMNTSDGNPQLIHEAKQMYWMIAQSDPKDRFKVIYSIIGPNMDVLCDICSLFDVEVEAFDIHYTIEGKPYTQEVEVLDQEEMDMYEAISDEELQDILAEELGIDPEEVIIEHECEDDYPDETPAETINRLYQTFFGRH